MDEKNILEQGNLTYPQFQHQISVRERYSNFVKTFITPNIQQYVDSYIYACNQSPDQIAAKFGGSSWNYHFQQENITECNKKENCLEKSCVLFGNFDIFFASNNKHFLTSDIFEKHKQFFNNIYKTLHDTLPNDFKKYYEITNTYSEIQQGNLFSKSVICEIKIELKKLKFYEI